MREGLELRGCRPNTVATYLGCARRYAAHFGRSPAELGAEEVRTFLVHLMRERRLSWSSQRVYVAALRVLYTEALGRSEDVHWLRSPKGSPRLPQVLGGSEVRRVLRAVKSLRYRAVLMTCYAAGLRVTEACAVRVDDIDSRRMVLRIRDGKGGRERYVMLSRRLLSFLRRYWRKVRPPGPYLFPGRGRAGRISRVMVHRTLQAAARDARLGRHVTTHTLRHSFATHLLECGVDVRVIQALLGHASIRSTTVYAKVTTGLIGRTRSPLDLLGTPRGAVLG
jgi:site-specific recombinase XerD